MELVRNSASHHYVAKLDELTTCPEGWFCLHFSLSKMTDHQLVVADLALIGQKLKDLSDRRDEFVASALKTYGGALRGFAYAFEDCDVLLLCHATSSADKTHLKSVYEELSNLLPRGFSEISALSGNSAAHHRMADRKLLSGRLQGAYASLGDANRVASIAARRRRRMEPLVMMVEDDRFTAHYASAIISREFDLVMCRSAEEAIGVYIETAPDIVFLDIHLPGLSGHAALEAIYAADPEAFAVMLSADTMKENVVKASMNGARKFLKKPFGRDRLIETIKSSPFVRAQMRTTSTGHDTLMS
jgi:two-component system, chemotaxis family, chemotaxis protein CheY